MTKQVKNTTNECIHFVLSFLAKKKAQKDSLDYKIKHWSKWTPFWHIFSLSLVILQFRTPLLNLHRRLWMTRTMNSSKRHKIKDSQ